MKIGYLLNSYPMTSTTFIRREIRRIEAGGTPVVRFAIRRWGDGLVDPADIEEAAVTRYVLAGRVSAMALDFLTEAVTNPRGMARALGTWSRLVRAAGGKVIRNTAYLMEAASLKRQAMRAGIDHLHAHFSTNTAAVTLMCARLGGPGYSFTAHGPDEFVDWGPAALREKVRGARFVAAITNYARVQLALAAGSDVWERLHIVRCGVDPDEFAPSEASFAGNSTLVCVGRLCPQKAQALIVEATAEVVRTHPQVRVVLIGDGESRAEVEAAIARHGLDAQVSLLGWRTNAEVREHLGQARALLLPSFAEGLPVVIMEALALGRPVISTFIAGIPELVDRDCGWIIPAGSVSDIAAAMRAALDAPEERMAEMGREGRRRIEERHDLRKNADALADLFRIEVAGLGTQGRG